MKNGHHSGQLTTIWVWKSNFISVYWTEASRSRNLLVCSLKLNTLIEQLIPEHSLEGSRGVTWDHLFLVGMRVSKTRLNPKTFNKHSSTTMLLVANKIIGAIPEDIFRETYLLPFSPYINSQKNKNSVSGSYSKTAYQCEPNLT